MTSAFVWSSTGNREQKITGEDIREQRTEVIQGQWKHRGVRSERWKVVRVRIYETDWQVISAHLALQPKAGGTKWTHVHICRPGGRDEVIAANSAHVLAFDLHTHD